MSGARVKRSAPGQNVAMSEMKVPVCPECGKVMVGESPATIGVSKEYKDGKPVPGSETFHGIFHTDCWPLYQAKLQRR
jgi:predicted RNA-binding Zn-ribbon protein involved in translation (DUF1610 family)